MIIPEGSSSPSLPLGRNERKFFNYFKIIKMNTRFKMKHSNVKARRWLEMHGYRDIQMFPHTRFSKDVNLDELKFDGICISNDKVALFQIKSNCKPTIEMQNKFKEFAEEYFVKLFWFNCPDYEEIDVYEYG